MGFDLDDDISVVLFDLVEREGPIRGDELFPVGVDWLKKHIGFVVDLISGQELVEDASQMLVL